jgi:hypothetical protein
MCGFEMNGTQKKVLQAVGIIAIENMRRKIVDSQALRLQI